MATTTDEQVGAGLDDPEGVLDEPGGDGDGEPSNVRHMNGAKSVEDLAAEGAAEEPEEEDGQFTIPGTHSGALTGTAGGRRPDVSEAKLAALPLGIKGEFRKGDTVRLIVHAQVTGVHVKDEMKNGEILRTRRTHHFTPLAVEPMEDD